jgi:hypothetical protein
MAKKKISKKQVMKKAPVTNKPAAMKSIAATDDNATSIVKVISIFGYIMAGLGIFVGLILLFGGTFIAGLLPIADIPQIPAALVSAAIVVIAVLMIAVSVFGIFLAKALWNYKNWARIVVIIFSAFGILNGLTALPLGILGILLHGLIIYFLGFDEKVKALFR